VKQKKKKREKRRKVPGKKKSLKRQRKRRGNKLVSAISTALPKPPRQERGKKKTIKHPCVGGGERMGVF